MTTINVTVGNTTKAKMLVKWLNEIKFVEKISLQKEESKEGNAKNIQKILSKIEPKQLFSEISDPLEYQNQLRNEW